MQIVPFPAYYQSVYTNFDFTSFSLISWDVEQTVLRNKPIDLTRQSQWAYFLHSNILIIR